MFPQTVTDYNGRQGLLIWNPEADRRIAKLIELCDEPLDYAEFRLRYLSRAQTGELPALGERQLEGLYGLIFDGHANVQGGT